MCPVASINSQTSCAVTFKHFGVGVVTETEAFAAVVDEKTKARASPTPSIMFLMFPLAKYSIQEQLEKLFPSRNKNFIHK